MAHALADKNWSASSITEHKIASEFQASGLQGPGRGKLYASSRGGHYTLLFNDEISVS